MSSKEMVKIDRLAAWVLFASMLLYFISGYGMTKGIINSTLATKLHNSYLIWPIFIAFIVHTFLAIRLAFIRWRILNPFTGILLGFVYLFFIFTMVYFQVFYKTSQQANDPTEVPSSTQQTSSPAIKTRTFSASELKQYNGQNGQPAYVAVEGLIYDVTVQFQNGSHFGHKAGEELTSAFFSRHIASQITKYPVVGTYLD